ncbi:undecaprenyl/decaprenyl-phosphate alpha-N-acetylglucosaminyl 1-phosphate transferase [Actinotalea ferrariae]|uniref:MraY family glycosyltransferase n=1 Tax=Actinotalea ferrariae TaxID=1386098 RepID=UPI001C8B2863|nr:MraY family glycosyltransferase [Actinotalea ferrariae]MBX9243945.1 undecaprenyl/decaprenyl-phosphate alpha-N-acetylglucosaminyl 1-phosphate transferase [Actinotalea ferrariae]
MRVYLLVMLVAAAVTFLTTPLARWLALRSGAITAVRDRDVHATPTPRMGGVAMLLGMAVAMVLASRMPFLEGVFTGSNQAWAILAGAAMVCVLGAADDIWDLDWITKLVGQVLAAGFMAWQGGVQLFSLPIAGLTIGSSYLSLGVTVLAVVVAINAVNFVDGLDGLAAGLIAIGGSGFFVYTYLLTRDISSTDYSNLASLVVAVLVGACLGFLPHNFHPARIFMGDSGSMVIGLTIAAAAIVVTGKIDPGMVSDRQAIPAFLPIALPVAVILLPLLDMGLAVVRRLGAGRSPFQPDRLHLHHRLLEIGHSHRRAVVIMYLWTAVFAFGAAALAVWTTTTVLIALGAGVLLALALTLGPLRGKVRGAPTARGAS